MLMFPRSGLRGNLHHFIPRQRKKPIVLLCKEQIIRGQYAAPDTPATRRSRRGGESVGSFHVGALEGRRKDGSWVRWRPQTHSVFSAAETSYPSSQPCHPPFRFLALGGERTLEPNADPGSSSNSATHGAWPPGTGLCNGPTTPLLWPSGRLEASASCPQLARGI